MTYKNLLCKCGHHSGIHTKYNCLFNGCLCKEFNISITSQTSEEQIAKSIVGDHYLLLENWEDFTEKHIEIFTEVDLLVKCNQIIVNCWPEGQYYKQMIHPFLTIPKEDILKIRLSKKQLLLNMI